MKSNIITKFAKLSVLLAFLYSSSYGQLSLTDTGNCLNHVLHAAITGTMPTPTGITGDDRYSGVFPIGFSFDFYGTTYTQVVIGSNGMLSFDITRAGAYCPWPISAALLGNPSARNNICGPWCDILISAGGSITYSTAGTAPNRKFSVTWCGSRMYSCTTQWTTSQIILYETSNIIEVHTANKTFCAWNSGRAITGVQNAAGTAATVAPMRDWMPTWTVTSPPEAWRFTPSGPGAYTVASTPYAPMPYATSGIYWYDSTTGAYLGSGPYLTVTPTVPTTYTAAALGCNDTTKASILVYPPSVGVSGVPHIDTYSVVHPSECGVCDGSITLHGINPHQIDTVFYSYNGVPQPSYVDSAALDSTITLSNLCGGTYDYIYVKVLDCPSNEVGPIDVVTPVLAISKITKSDPTICGYYDGWIKLHGLTPLKPVSVAYNKDGTPQPPYTDIVAADSTVVIPSLGAGNYTGIAATVRYCTALGTPITLNNPPGFPPSFTYDLALGCQGDTVFMTNTTTPTGYFTYWNYGDGSGTDSLKDWHIFRTDLLSPKYANSYVVEITYNTVRNHDPACAMTFRDTIDIDHRIQASFNTTFDTVCRGVDAEFNNASFSNYGPRYLWEFGDGFTDDTSTSPYHAYDYAATFPVKLTVTDTIGCTSDVTNYVTAISLDIRAWPHDTDVCLKGPMKILVDQEVLENPDRPVSYAWTQTPSGTNLNAYNVHNPEFSGIGNFTLTVTANTSSFPGFPNGCEANDEVVVRSHPPLTITNLTASPQKIKLGTSIHLNADGAVYYRWSPENGTLDNPNINNPIATPTDTFTVYTVHAMNLWGCLDSATVTVIVDDGVHEFVPSAFTPNGDGKNDVFRIMKLKFEKLVDFRVYNRWGTQVFQTTNPEVGWDGTLNGEKQDLGTYIYNIIVALPNGENKIYKGNVTLIR